MPCLSLILLFLPVLSVSATVTLGIPTATGVQVPTDVKWTREHVDPRVFDLRFINSDGADVGIAATVQADKCARSGTVPVVFPREGKFTLKAVDFNSGNTVLAQSEPVKVDPIPPIPTGQPTTSSSSSDPPSTSSASCPASTTSATPSTSSSGSTASPTGTSSPSSSSTAPPTFPSIGASSKPSSNTPAIVGGVIGGLALLALLLLIAILLKRRRSNARARRLTFHRDLMVQHRPTPADLERGTNSVLPPLVFQQPVTMPTPRGPTRAEFPASAIVMPAPTPRQTKLDNRILELEQQMLAIRRQNRGQAGIKSVLEHMRMQAEWLRDQRDSPWARGETEEPPPHLDMYME